MIVYAIHCAVCMTLLVTGCLLIIDGLPERDPRKKDR